MLFLVFLESPNLNDIHCVKQAYMDICQYSLRIVPRIVFFKAVKNIDYEISSKRGTLLLNPPPKKSQRKSS